MLEKTTAKSVVRILVGDARLLLKHVPDSSVHCCVTSPPYFGLRDYGVAGQIGLEPTPDAFVAELVGVFREVRRVLRSDGTLWLNLGDSYSGSGRGGNPDAGTKQGTNRGSQTIGVLYGREHESATAERARIKIQHTALEASGCKPKDLIGIPWMVAFALRADGWYLRQDIIWSKPNPMPESVRDRCTKAHEYIFILSKNEKYYYDHRAIKEPAVSDHQSGNGFKRGVRLSYQNADGSPRGNPEQWKDVGGKRNKRSVWHVMPKPFKESHFATFPPELIEPCILAGCPLGGIVLDPFSGAGTTALVAARHGRNALALDIKPEYVEIAKRRLAAEGFNA